jgi:hypothetical protein
MLYYNIPINLITAKPDKEKLESPLSQKWIKYSKTSVEYLNILIGRLDQLGHL